MNAYERHVIHAALQNYDNISTYSVGSEPNRRIVVTYGRSEGHDNRDSRDNREGRSRNNNFEKRPKKTAEESNFDTAPDRGSQSEYKEWR
jgi:hypothetical protein